MESTSLFPSPTLTFLSSSSAKASYRKKPVRRVVAASRGPGDRDYRGKLVDENMIVLRMRIREVKMLETSKSPPSNWMEWEKRYYDHYNEDVCQAVGLLQSYLMNIRPSLALGFLGLISLSVPMSTVMGMVQAIEMAKGLLSGLS
ncbi:hypothetical protein PVL29_018647 [Vitis rotundifolia]|uniref:Uncharacterized protein n=1 Tax=Vitis rotundifolia TaxID=103349 RepID=A0AA39DGH0_VITRO|nr:hypothetical protein PVL29_018647 [Vitis rotundifolia]